MVISHYLRIYLVQSEKYEEIILYANLRQISSNIKLLYLINQFIPQIGLNHEPICSTKLLYKKKESAGTVLYTSRVCYDKPE